MDPEYDSALDKFYGPYHDFIDVIFRLAVNTDSVPEVLINLSAVVGFEAVPLHSTYFPKLWLDIYKAQVSKPFLKKSAFFISINSETKNNM